MNSSYSRPASPAPFPKIVKIVSLSYPPAAFQSVSRRNVQLQRGLQRRGALSLSLHLSFFVCFVLPLFPFVFLSHFMYVSVMVVYIALLFVISLFPFIIFVLFIFGSLSIYRFVSLITVLCPSSYRPLVIV